MKEDSLYLTISKTANLIGVQPHVLRFWEKNFIIINPKKNGFGGRRYYSSSDIELLIFIKGLLYTEGFTIKGAVNFINEKYKKNNNPKSKDQIITCLYPELDKAIDLIKDGYKIIKRNLN
jgi:DNA-binding transcriptional MerR regulator